MFKRCFVLCILCAMSLSAATVTFTKDVAPIFYKNCTECHRPGEIAPMSLMTYKDARPWVKSIREKVADRVMPPWLADPKIGQFRNDRRLNPKDIETIVAWVDGGALPGDSKDLPSPPEYYPGWNIGKPDEIFSMPVEYEVPASGTVVYQYYTIPTNFTEDHWLQAAEIRFGNRGLVHHAIAFLYDPKAGPALPSGLRSRLDLLPPPPKDPTGARFQPKLGVLLHGSAPGEQAMRLPPGTARLMKAGSELIFQIHYTPNGTPGKDRTSIGLVYAKQPPEREQRVVGVMNGRFAIPAGEANYRVDSTGTFSEDAEITALFPHMHLRGKSFEFRLIYPDGRSEVLLNVPKYDFNWQSGYNFEKPVMAPKGARLECTAYFDNSKGNRFNPDSDRQITWGDQTWEEMMIGFTTYSVPNARVAQRASK